MSHYGRTCWALVKSQSRQLGCVPGSHNKNTAADGFSLRESMSIWRSRTLPLHPSPGQAIFRNCCRVAYHVPANGLNYKTGEIAGILNRG